MNAFSFPMFQSDNDLFNKIYDYRCKTFYKHIVETPEGRVITEFLPPVPWAGSYNTINCAAAHHIREARWLSDSAIGREYITFWCRHPDEARRYSFPFADSVLAFASVTGEDEFALSCYETFKQNYHAWCREHRKENGLFVQTDDRDGMEYSVSGSGFRPTINSYMAAEAKALAVMAEKLGKPDDTAFFLQEYKNLKKGINTCLYDGDDRFYETVNPDGHSTKVRELIGYIPFLYGLAEPGQEEAFSWLWRKDGFYGDYGPTTVQRTHPDFNKSFDHECLWNGPSWPFATTQTLEAMRYVLQNEPNPTGVQKADFMRLLTIYAGSQQKDGVPYVDEDLDADTGRWLAHEELHRLNRPDKDRGVDYNHSTFMDLIITGMAGLMPFSDGSLGIHSLCETDSFSLTNIPYRGHRLHLFCEKGLITLEADGKTVASHQAVPFRARL